MANSDDIRDALIRHDIDLLRVDAGTRSRIVKMVNNLERDLIKELKDIDPTSGVRIAARNRKLSQLVTSTAPTVKKAYQQIEDVSTHSLNQIIEAEFGTQADIINRVLGVDLVSHRASRQVIESLANNAAVEGEIVKKWWSKQGRDLTEAFNRQIRDGMLGNETIDQLTRRIRGTRAGRFTDGLMQGYRNKARTLVRTSTLTVANDARYAMYQENSDVIQGVQWTSTLDSRTSDICIALDGSAWTLDGKRMEGTSHTWRGPPPAHWNCRSTLVPVTKSWSQLTQNPKIKKKLDALPKGKAKSLRASMDGAVSAKLNYEDWLRGKGEDFQLEVLGETKHRLWQQGLLSLTDLIDQSHKPISTEALLAKTSAKQKKVTTDLAIASEVKAAQDAFTREEGKRALERVENTARNKVARARLAKIKDGKVPYKSRAYNELVKKPGFKRLPVQEQMSMINKRATLLKKQSLLADYRIATKAGRRPSNAAQSAFDALSDKAQRDILSRL